MSVQAYKNKLQQAREQLAQKLLSGIASAAYLAITRHTIALMAYELREHPGSVTLFDELQEHNLSGPDLWHHERQQQAIKKFQSEQIHPRRKQRKRREYLTFCQETVVSTARQRRFIRDRVHGVTYIVRHNDKVQDIVIEILNGLMRWAERHESDEDFYRLSPQDGLVRMLFEEPRYLAALRVAQRLPPDVTRVKVTISRPDHVLAVETAIGFIPIIGSAVALYEAYTGRDLFGYKLDTVDRSILAASVLLPAAGRLAKGGRALYTANRMQRMYGRDAGQWSRALSSGERLSADAAGYRALRQGEQAIRQGRAVSKQLQRQVDSALKRGIMRGGASRASVPRKVREAYERLAARHDILNGLDELALQRVLDRGTRRHHVKGQLLEELLENRLAEDFLTADDGMRALGFNTNIEDVEFIPGHLIRDRFGRQLTDGMLAKNRGDKLEILAIFEAKAGSRAARELHLSSGSRGAMTAGDRSELRAYAKDVYRELLERARIENTSVNATIGDIERMVIMSERGGQVQRDIERLAAGADEELTRIFVGSVETAVELSPTRTKVVGVVPKDVNTRAITRSLKQQNYNFEVWGINITERDLSDIADELAGL